ncbi:MAG TPA: class I SAM-dependent methyltransferase [Vicinamibacterales bacterium]|nr:class I SAM-dependent methyltransferase [Vicinamibacterales bacterium]
MLTSLVDFYRRYGISPVRQDISNLDAHFTRRAGLYRHLALLPSFFRGRHVLEIGPGGGFNSLYTATLQPSRYVLLEPNPAGVEGIARLFDEFPPLADRIEIVSSLIEEYDTDERFDFVLCEGVLGLAGVPDPTVLLRAAARFVAPGGVLVITCNDAISDFPETLRRLLGQLLIAPDDPLDVQAATLTPVFGPHLSSLSGMSRRHDDWVIDNLLSPASIGPYLSIPEAIDAIAGDFDLFSTSPHYGTDWRWYKSLTASNLHYNERAVQQYWENAHSLFDYRRLFPPREAAANVDLYRQCIRARDLVRAYEERRDVAVVPVIRERLADLGRAVRAFSDDIADAIVEVQDLLQTTPPDALAVAASHRFGPWFGRGQQYLSFSRR